ncbi:unnamed protein product, partial [Rotaria sp. Silwood1]
DQYILDLSSSDISKNEMDLICSFLRPEQIIGLKFGKTNFDLVDRFLSSFSNQQSFTRLRSLWIDHTIIVDELFMSRLSSMINYNNLISIRFDRIHISKHDTLSKYSFDSLSHLVTSSSNDFQQLSKEIPSHLTCLHMYFNSPNDMDQFIRPNMYQLKSLGVGIQVNLNDINQFMLFFNDYQWSQLIQFNLNFNVEINMEFDMLKEILSTMYRLKYLTLILNQPLTVDNNILNGMQWKSFLSTSFIFLKIFNFKFSIQQASEQNIRSLLNTFKSQWWLEEKRWFVEYDTYQNVLITVPYFASKIFNNYHSYSLHLIQNPKIFYSNINELNIDLIKYNDFEQMLMFHSVFQPNFNHVTRLSLNGYLTTHVYDIIQNNIDLSMIKHFKFSSTINTTETLIELINNMINLSSIHIQYLHSLNLFSQLSSPNLSIRHLVLFDYEPTTRKQLFYHICRIFPRLTHLTTDYHSRRKLCYLLNELIHLEQLTLRLSKDQYAPNYGWIKQHSRLQMNTFEMKVFNIAYREKKFILWINTNNNIDLSHHDQYHTLKKCSIQ